MRALKPSIPPSMSLMIGPSAIETPANIFTIPPATDAKAPIAGPACAPRKEMKPCQNGGGKGVPGRCLEDASTSVAGRIDQRHEGRKTAESSASRRPLMTGATVGAASAWKLASVSLATDST